MSYRFYRCENGKNKYQAVHVDVKKEADGFEYRVPILVDVDNKKDATIFPISDGEMAHFIACWFDVWLEEVGNEE